MDSGESDAGFFEQGEQNRRPAESEFHRQGGDVTASGCHRPTRKQGTYRKLRQEAGRSRPPGDIGAARLRANDVVIRLWRMKTLVSDQLRPVRKALEEL